MTKELKDTMKIDDTIDILNDIIDKVENLELYDDVPGIDAKVCLFDVIEILDINIDKVRRLKGH